MKIKRESTEIMTVREFAKSTGLCENAVRKLIREQKLCYMKIGNRYYIHYPKTISYIMHEPNGRIGWNMKPAA